MHEDFLVFNTSLFIHHETDFKRVSPIHVWQDWNFERYSIFVVFVASQLELVLFVQCFEELSGSFESLELVALSLDLVNIFVLSTECQLV